MRAPLLIVGQGLAGTFLGHACERAGLAPPELLFVDDSPVNVEAAHRLGFDVHLFEDPAALRPALKSRGLL